MARAKRWTDDVLDSIQYMIDTNTCYKDIARYYGITTKTLHNIIWEHGIKGVGTGNVPKPRPSRKGVAV